MAVRNVTPGFSISRVATVALCFTAAAPLVAQSATDALPRISLDARADISKLSAWPGASVKVDRDAWVAAFAVTRGSRALPVQLLSPAKPGQPALVKAGQRVPVRRLDNFEMLHLVNYGTAPVLVVFASSQAPDLSAFAAGTQWGRDLLLDTLVANQQEMVDLLGKTIFGTDGRYAVEVRSTPEASPISRTASNWMFDGGCAGESAGWVRRTGRDGLGLYASWEDVDPLVRIEAGQSSPQGQILRQGNGAPVQLKGGAVASVLPPSNVGTPACRGYRVAWWPRVGEPLPTDSASRANALEPRYPDVSVPVVGTVPSSRTATTSAGQRDAASPSPRLIVNPREASGDPQAIRSLQGVPKPNGDGTVRPRGGS